MVSEQDKSPGPSEAAADDKAPDSAIVAEQRSAAAESVDGNEPVTVDSAGAAAQQESADETAAVPGVEQLQEQLAQAQAELADARDQAIRAQAESQNARRRAEKDVTKARLFALEKFVQDLLPVIDNLERATESAQSEAAADSSMLQGIELTLKSFLDALKRFNVEPIDPVAEPFDPQLHEAISMVKNAEVEPNTVLNVVQKGYSLNGRLVRAAMVVVSSA